MKTIFLCLMFAFCTTLHFAQVTEEWLSMYTVEWGVIAEATVIDDEGNVYITGTGHQVIPLTGDDFYTLKYNSAGILQWDATYNGTANEFDFAKAISVDPLGNVYVTGESPGVINGFSSGKDYLTIKYDSQGNELWVQRYHGNNSFTSYNFDSPFAIETDEFGNVYVTGQSVPDGATSGTGYFCTVKYSTDGNFQWARYNLGQSGVGYSVKVSASGNVYVSGSASASTGLDFITIKYNSSGVEQWAKRYSNGFILQPIAMEIDASENVYVTGGDLEIHTIKYNSAGDSIWASIYTGPQGFSHPNDLAVDEFGNVYVTGRSANAQVTGTEYVIVKYNSAGQELWTARYDGLGNEQFENSSEAIDLDAAGNVYVTGKSQGVGDLGDYATVKYNSAGIEQWAIRYHRPPDAIETAIGIHVSSDQEVYVSGNSISSGASPPHAIITIKYSQSPSDVSEISSVVPDNFMLSQNYPNPFNPTTKISWQSPISSHQTLKVYDMLGNEVATLVNEEKDRGVYSVNFDASNLSSGIYFYRLQAGSFVETKRMILIR
ncbi:MAG: SBBP repeat-containing protein [Ignavibacterium sp.]